MRQTFKDNKIKVKVIFYNFYTPNKEMTLGQAKQLFRKIRYIEYKGVKYHIDKIRDTKPIYIEKWIDTPASRSIGGYAPYS